MVTAAPADWVGSAALVAVTLMVFGDGGLAGAVYSPVEVIVPTVLFPPATPLTFQVTFLLDGPVMVAVKVIVWPSSNVALAGDMDILTAGAGVKAALPPPQPSESTTRHTRRMTDVDLQRCDKTSPRRAVPPDEIGSPPAGTRHGRAARRFWLTGCCSGNRRFFCSGLTGSGGTSGPSARLAEGRSRRAPVGRLPSPVSRRAA